jgi:hypothetical protein
VICLQYSHLTRIYSRGLLCAPCVGLAFLFWLRFALRSFALWRVFAIAPSSISGWRAFSSVSLCNIHTRGVI